MAKLRGYLFLTLILGTISAVIPVASLATTTSSINRPLDVKPNRAFVYHGKIVRPNGSVPTGEMQATVKIFSPDPGLCLLWAENVLVDVKQGSFAVELGHESNRIVGPQGGVAPDFQRAFINNTALTHSSAICENGNSYTPTMTDDRLLTAAFNDNGTVINVTGMPIKSVPYAMQSEQISGFGLANLMKISGTGSSVQFTTDEVQSLKDLLGGDIDWDMKGRRVTNVADPVAALDAANRGWVQAAIVANGPGISSGTDAAKPISGTSGAIYIATDSRIMYRYTGSGWAPLTGTQAAQNEIVYSTGSNTTSGIAPMNNAVLLSNGSGVPAWGAISNDTFLQYALLAGRAGGQTLIGGTGAGDDLTLNSTSNAVKGDILLNTGGGFVGVGTTSPISRFQVGTNSATGSSFHVDNSVVAQGSVRITTDASANYLQSGLDTTAASAKDLRIGPYGTTASWMTIANNGNVGVGTTSPGTRLEVVGGGVLQTWRQSYTAGEPMVQLWATNGAPAPGPRASLLVNSAAFEVYDQDATASRLFIEDGTGNVGVATTSPNAALQVNGTINGKAAVSNASTTIDFSTGNLQYTASSCGAFALHNVKDGGAYTFVVKGTAPTTCSFTAFTGAGTGAVTVRMPVGHMAATSGTHTMYNFMVIGADIYVSWVPGYL